MKVRLFAWVAGKWEGTVPFSEPITIGKFRESLPTKSRRKLYVTRHMRLVHIRFPWNAPMPEKPMAEITFSEAEIFRLAKFARRDRTEEELLKAILNA